MGNGKLALVLPTFRFDETARHCIRTVAAMGGDDIDVFIGDNSENPAKWDFLHKLAARSENVHVFCHEKNIGGANTARLMEKTDNEFVALASDDDLFAPDYFLAGRDILKANADCSAANGLHLSFTWKGDTLEVVPPSDYRQASPVDRLAAYYYWGNSLCYSVYRASATHRLHAYFADRPFWPSYLDQFIAYTLLSAGKYIIEPKRQLFVYNNNHWGDPKVAIAQDGKWFAGGGLPTGFTYLNRLCWTADIVHFFNSTYRPDMLSDAESDAIVDNLYARMFAHEFLIHLRDHADEIGTLFQHAPDRVQALRQILATPWREVHTFLGLFVHILEGFNVEVAAKYQAFVDASLRVPRHEARMLETVDA